MFAHPFTFFASGAGEDRAVDWPERNERKASEDSSHEEGEFSQENELINGSGIRDKSNQHVNQDINLDDYSSRSKLKIKH